jgi:asparagine synthase (glutamine-hydrolysing)
LANLQVQSIRPNRLGNAAARPEILHWDGRLDNREDLIRKLRESLRGDTSDAALALAGYERWGTGGLVHPIGDWSAVFHDPANAAVVLASDFAGVRPLYYHVRRGQVLWSRDLQSLVDKTQISELDEDYVAGFLTLGGCPNRTPYRGIYPVPAGHAVRISATRTEILPFWTLPAGDVIRYESDHRYEEQLRGLFREAVAVRLQTGSPVLAELSGGLDSSSVVSMANQLIREGAVPAPRLVTVSYLWRNSIDESFIREVESYCGTERAHLSTHTNPVISAAQTGKAVPAAFEPLRSAVADTADGFGAKVFLTGRNGDLVMGNWFDDSLQVAGHLRRLRLGRACKEALAWSKVLGLPIYSTLWRALRAALPAALSPAAIYAQQDGSYAPRSLETSLAPRFCGNIGEAEAAGFFSSAWMQAPPERRKYFRSLSMMQELRSLQAPETMQHLDYTHPFAHRPLVEFLMAVPPDVLCGPGEPRRLMRRALADLWPPKLRKRRSKGLFGAPWHEALLPMAHDLLQSRTLQVIERGFVDRTSFVSRLERLTAGSDCNEAQLRNIVLLEFWLRNRRPAHAREAEAQAA